MSENVPILSVPPLTVIAPEDNELLAPSARVPELIVVVPVKVLAAFTVIVPAPLKVRPDVPERIDDV